MIERRDTSPMLPDRHWPGYEGEDEAQSYPVEERGRFRLLLTLLLIPFVFTAMAVMVEGWHLR